jgi:hypothetical protein
MFIKARLAFVSYIPEKLTKGMWFRRPVSMIKLRTQLEYDELFELIDVPRDMDSYIQMNGYPVLPTVVSIPANKDHLSEVIAHHDVIGWWDDCEEESELLRDISIKDINPLLEFEDGEIGIDVEDELFEEEGIAKPIIYEGKVTLIDPYNIPIYEDDEPEEDSAGYTIDDRYNPDDYETE